MSGARLHESPGLAGALCAWGFLWLAGCGAGEDGESLPARFERLHWEPVGAPATFPEGRLLAHWEDFEVGRQHAGWDFGGARRWVGSFRGRPVLRVSREEPVEIVIPISAAFRDACVVTVMATVPGRGADLTATLVEDGRTLGRARRTPPSTPDIQAIALRIESETAGSHAPTRLVLSVAADSAPLGIAAISLREATEGMELGAAVFGGRALVELEGDARLATVLAGGGGFETRFEVREDGERLSFSHGRPAFLEDVIGDARLRLRLEGDSGGVSETLLELGGQGGSAARWRDASVALDPWRGRRVRASVDLVGASGETLCLVTMPRVVHPRRESPTVLLVTSDTHRADHVGFVAGSDALETRALDVLAREGVAFLDAVSSANNTTPSHAALLTGLSPRDTGLVANRKRLAEEARTLAEVFAERGFATLAAVSAAPVKFASSGLGQGFDRYSIPARSPSRTAEETVARALEALEDFTGAAVFCWVHLFDAHGPYEPPDDVLALYYDESRDPFDRDRPVADRRLAPTWGYTITDPDYTEALYKGEITFLDRQLSRLLALERVRRGVTAFTADHGEVLRHGRERPFDHGGLSWSTLAVPLILRAPGLAAGTTRSDAVRQIDVGRTLLDLAGLEDAPFPGRSLLRAEGGPRFAIEANGISASIINEGWMLRLFLRSVPPTRGARGGELHELELFDLSADPFCLEDLAAAAPERCARLRGVLVRWLGQASARSLVTSSFAPDSEVERQLAALGYVSMVDAQSASWIEADCDCPRCAPFE
ncbi:MAG: sulfatase-like hydrolase/transferase [Planctomycetota bacterium]|nr:sulfatase-like hydrolase/transferase [Planctomycetota bacterium]